MPPRSGFVKGTTLVSARARGYNWSIDQIFGTAERPAGMIRKTEDGGGDTAAPLTTRRAIVCGSTQGIGRACAFALARQGADVTLVARNEDALRDTCAALPAAAHRTHHYVCADFTDPEALAGAIRRYLAEHGPAHILVNNSGGPPAGPIATADPDKFLDAFSQHLVCNQLLVQAVVPGMRAARYGRVINIISTSVKQPIQGLGVSNTVRGAVASWAKTLAGELGPDGITVNNILPGYTETGRLRSLIKVRAERRGVSEDDIEAEMLKSVPLRRFASPDETAAAAAFLAGPNAAYITGVSLPVDGGKIEGL